MRNFTLQKLNLAILSLGVVFFTACGDDDGEPALVAPNASFTSVVDGKTATFTNTSTGEATYVWDFGDGETSTEEAPSHTYDANGSYVVKLTATNDSGSDDSQAVLEIVNVTIDGDLSDWDDVEALSFDGEGSIKEVKMENLGNQKLYFYILSTSNATSFLDVFLNLDYEKTITEEADTTGLFTGVYPMSNLGWDVLFEGFFGSTTGRDNLSGMFYGIFYPNDEDGVFTNNIDFAVRDEPALTSTQITYSDMQSVGSDIAYEFSIDLTAFPANLQPEEGARIQFFIDEWVNSPESVDGWWASFIGHYPTGQSTEEGTAATYTLK